MSEYLRVHVERVMYSSDSYFVMKVRALDSSEAYTPREVTITGHLFGIHALYSGVPIELHGSWGKHPKYGRQFKAKSWKPWADSPMKVKSFMMTCAPNIITDLQLLDSLTAKHGTNLFNILSDVEKLTQGVTATGDLLVLREISQKWSEMMALGTLADSLAEYKLGISAIAAIYQKFGLGAEEVLKSNPYRLVEVESLSFIRVDEIARDRGIGLNDLRRLGAAIICSIRECTRQGHLFVRSVSLPRVVTDIISEYGCPPFSIELEEACAKALETLVESKSVVLDPGTGVYLPHHFQFERDTGSMLSKMLLPKDFPIDANLFITDYEKNNQISLSDNQKEAVNKLMLNNVLAVTGAPGTGKTTLIRVFVGLFRTLGLNFALMAPTGIASKRLANVTSSSASTIHRALKYDGFSWGHNSSNPLEYDAVVLDEASMVEMELLYRLVSALPSHAMLVVVGDHDQLPSVGPGNVLRELLSCTTVPSIRLEHVFRQAESSDIVRAAHHIRRGLNPLTLDLKEETEFQFVKVHNEETLSELIVKIAAKLKAKKASFQIIAPKYEGIVGVDNLNRKLQLALNPDKGQDATDILEQPVRVGDRLMVIKNNYRLNVFNGDLGKLVSIGQEGLTLKIYGVGENDDEVFVTIPNDQAPMLLKLAYSVTCHKCLSPNTIVETEKGLEEIANISQEGKISTPLGIANYQNKICNPPSKMVRITTQGGYGLEATLNHGIDVWCPTSSKYVRREVGQLKIGQYLRINLGSSFSNDQEILLPIDNSVQDVRAIPYPIPTKLDEDMAEFLGLMVGDGTVWRSGFRLVKRHLEVVDRFHHLCETLFKVPVKRSQLKHGFRAEVNSVHIASWLQKFGGISPKNKYVPNCILKANQNLIRCFLRGLFEDGTVNIKGDTNVYFNPRPHVDHIEFSSCYEKIQKILPILLLKVGIWCTQKGRYTYLYSSQAKKFGEEIGFISGLKQGRLNLGSYSPDSNFPIPVSRNEIEDIISVNGGRSSLTNTDKNIFERGFMSRHQMNSFLDKMVIETESTKKLRERLKYHHVRITSLDEMTGTSICVEVPDGHQFIQNGFCGWNSQGEEFDTVVMPIVRTQGRMLQRNLLYTAITRAKKKVYLLGESDAIEKAVANDKVIQRNTVLGKIINSSESE